MTALRWTRAVPNALACENETSERSYVGAGLLSLLPSPVLRMLSHRPGIQSPNASLPLCLNRTSGSAGASACLIQRSTQIRHRRLRLLDISPIASTPAARSPKDVGSAPTP